VPRKNPIPTREREICARFRAARESAGLRQAELARRIGIDVNRLSSYEHGRSPVPYWIGDRIAAKTFANQRWVATGQLPRRPYAEVDEIVAATVPKSALFSDVYDALLATEMNSVFRSIGPVAPLEANDSWDTAFDHQPPLRSPPSEMMMTVIRNSTKALIWTAHFLDRESVLALSSDLLRLSEEYHGKPHRRGGTFAELLDRERDEVIRPELEKRWRSHMRRKK